METSLATEFPADNPLLGAGAAWVCATPRGRALPTRRRMILVTPILLMPEGAVPPPHSVPAPVLAKVTVAEPTPVAAPKPVPAKLVAPAVPAAAVVQDTFQTFVSALAQSLLASGQARAAGVVPALFETGSVPDGELSAEALAALWQRGILERGTMALTPSFRARADAWRSVLSGTSDDLSACGDTTLDGWSSELLCALSAAPSGRASEYRRELRKRGVAAFGLLGLA